MIEKLHIYMTTQPPQSDDDDDDDKKRNGRVGWIWWL